MSEFATALTTPLAERAPWFGAAAPAAAAQPMRFGDFPITETCSFPPAAGAQCWAYLTLNAEIALSLPGNAALQQLIRSPRARVSVDGQWLWWALRRKYPGQPLLKLSGADLIHELAAHCVAGGERLLLLGSSAIANAAAVQQLRRRWPGLAVAGYAPPGFDAGSAAESRAHRESLAAIDAWRPHYVVLGLGAGKEQRFALQAMDRLDGRVHGLLCFGGSIDLASGAVRRAPPLWQRLGLEGIHRVISQPSRLWRFIRVLRILPLLARGRY